MSPRRKGGRQRRSLLFPAAVVVILAAAIVAVFAHLVRDLPRGGRAAHEPASASRSELRRAAEALLGPLDPAGTRVNVGSRAEAEELAATLERLARRHPGEAEFSPGPERRGGMTATLRLEGEAYPVELTWSEGAQTPQPGPSWGPPAEDGARLAVVIDDLGGDLATARSFLDLPVTVTPAVLPGLPASTAVAEFCRERGREFLLHLPMEPLGYPKVKPGPGALLAGMGESELRGRVADALASVPGASGVNNHMGSRLTAARSAMDWVMDELRRRDLYFLDSVTSPASVAAEAARAAGIGWCARDVFLDNEQEVPKIEACLDKAIARARRNGSAIAIGHGHPTTLESLARWVPKFEEAGVEVVPLGRLVRRPEG